MSVFSYSNAPLPFSSKVCYIKYREPSSVGVAQHLTNTVFIDRALIVVPCAEGEYAQVHSSDDVDIMSVLCSQHTSCEIVLSSGWWNRCNSNVSILHSNSRYMQVFLSSVLLCWIPLGIHMNTNALSHLHCIPDPRWPNPHWALNLS